MATVATVLAMDPGYRPFERPPDPAVLWSAVPRGLRGFTVNSGTLDAKPVDDTQTLELTATLPANFAYVFAELSIQINQNQAANWIRQYSLNLQNWYQGFVGLSQTWVFGLTTHPLGGVLSPGGPDQGIPSVGIPKAPMWAPAGTSGILISIQARNTNATVAAAGTINSYINFWEFDLEQVRKYPINTPLPTHAR